MLVLGAAVLPRTSRTEKSVCVLSVEAGPRSWVRGLGDERREGVVLNGREVDGCRRGREVVLSRDEQRRGCDCGERRKVLSSWMEGRRARNGGILRA